MTKNGRQTSRKPGRPPEKKSRTSGVYVPANLYQSLWKSAIYANAAHREMKRKHRCYAPYIGVMGDLVRDALEIVDRHRNNRKRSGKGGTNA